MATVQDHYDKLLAVHYVWMAGGFEAALEMGAMDLGLLGIVAAPGHLAVDLGAGFGMHAIPLARSGQRVLAVDTSRALLDEMKMASGALPIDLVEDDLLNFPRHLREPAGTILCLGDTLTHLERPQDVEALVESAYRSLASGGQFAATFRDYTVPLEGDQRFIPVRSSPDKIQTCFLEYESYTVKVHDLFHVLNGEQWDLFVSSYRKLRLSPGWVRDRLSDAGFSVRAVSGPRRMQAIVATKP